MSLSIPTKHRPAWPLLLSALLALVLAPAMAHADTALTSAAFFEDAGSTWAYDCITSTASIEARTNTTFASHTHLGGATDATHLTNVLDALDWIDYCNKCYRTPNGLNELRVSDELMAKAERNANFSTDYYQHASDPSSTYPSAENLYVTRIGKRAAYKGWFDDEKAILEAAIAENPAIGTYLETHEGPSPISDELYSNIGHYLNLISPFTTTGIGLNADGAAVQVFTWDYKDMQTYTVDEYRTRVLAYYRHHGVPIERLSGSDRYQTMAAIVWDGFEQSDTVVLATGQNFPDALAASALAGASGAPVVLTDGSRIPDSTYDTLFSLGVKNVLVVGGEAAVSSNVTSILEGMGLSVTRLAGSSRQETSLAVLNALAPSAPTEVIVATGATFADSLSVGPYAYAHHAPIVLTQGDGMLSQAALGAIASLPSVNKVVIVGGTSAVSSAVESQLAGYDVVRLGGENRYATSALIAAWSVEQGMAYDGVGIATGQNFPDALAGAALCGRNGSVMVLAQQATDATIPLLVQNKEAIDSVKVFGGEAVVSQGLVDELSAALVL